MISQDDQAVVARIIKETRERTAHSTHRADPTFTALAATTSIAKGLADHFATSAKNFDREKFLTRCGVK